MAVHVIVCHRRIGSTNRTFSPSYDSILKVLGLMWNVFANILGIMTVADILNLPKEYIYLLRNSFFFFH